MDRIQQLQRAAAKATGHHYKSKRVLKIIDQYDWQGFWPVIDAEGFLTGDITEGDGEEWINIDDLAMIDIEDLPRAEQRRIEHEQDNGTWDGYGRIGAAK